MPFSTTPPPYQITCPNCGNLATCIGGYTGCCGPPRFRYKCRCGRILNLWDDGDIT